jgi:glutaredoxin 2
MTTLYHYVHCPFCLRVRMAFGLLRFSYRSQFLPYNDEKTPLSLTGKKMLPIVEFSDESLNESLDIIKKVDTENILKLELINEARGENLAMPYWVYTQEFDNESRAYFLKKKEAKRGPFPKLMTKADGFLKELEPLLKEVEESLNPFLYNESDLTILDIMLASHLWGLYVVPEFQFSPKLHSYLQEVKKKCSFNYHEDYWDLSPDE